MPLNLVSFCRRIYELILRQSRRGVLCPELGGNDDAYPGAPAKRSFVGWRQGPPQSVALWGGDRGGLPFGVGLWRKIQLAKTMTKRY